MSRKLIVTRTVTPDECPWLDITFWPGDELTVFSGATYGCINWANGIAATSEFVEGFFEFPIDAFENAPAPRGTVQLIKENHEEN